MLEYLLIRDTIDAIDGMNPRNDTGGLGQIILWGVLGSLLNVANTFYTYLLSIHPLTILLAYLLSYFTFAYFITKLEVTMRKVDMDATPNHNPRIRYGKGK